MDLELEGKAAIVTGGSRGIGIITVPPSHSYQIAQNICCDTVILRRWLARRSFRLSNISLGALGSLPPLRCMVKPWLQSLLLS